MTATQTDISPSLSRRAPASAFWLMLAVLALLWGVVIYQLSAQWMVYEQYAYGWAVPFLCLYLVGRGTKERGARSKEQGGKRQAQEGKSFTAETRRHGEGKLMEADLVHPHPGPLPRGEREKKGDFGESPKQTGEAPVLPCCDPEGEWRNVVRPYLDPLPEERRWGSKARFALILFALLLLPTRIIVEANPIWRAASYAITLEVIGITLALLYLVGGRSWLKQFAFPVLFFLVAVPWPSAVEGVVIQTLTGFNTGATVELLGLLGVPALQHGNVIEVSTGMVGIDEACSGVRSVQATLMMTLFFGAFYQLTWPRRFILLAGGMVLALICNLGRTFFLSWIASRDGIAAVGRWHDPAGVALLIACFLGIWLLAEIFKKVESRKEKGESRGQRAESREPIRVPHFNFQLSAFSFLFIWILAVEATTQLWFGMHERKGITADWSLNWPTNRLEFREIPISKTAQDQLKYSAGHNYAWREADGTVWQSFYLQWNSARNLKERATVHLAKTHNPEMCLTAIGKTLTDKKPVNVLELPGLSLPYRTIIFDDHGKKLHVFFVALEEGSLAGTYANMRTTSQSRLQAAWDGSRGKGQRVMEFAIWGFNDLAAADNAFQKLMFEIIRKRGF